MAELIEAVEALAGAFAVLARAIGDVVRRWARALGVPVGRRTRTIPRRAARRIDCRMLSWRTRAVMRGGR